MYNINYKGDKTRSRQVLFAISDLKVIEYGVLASASRDFDLQTRKELLEFISKGRMETLEFINSVPYRKSNDVPPPFCDAYTFTSGYSSGYISFFVSKGSNKWVRKSFHRSNEFDNSLAFALEKAGFYSEIEKREETMENKLCSYCGANDVTVIDKPYTLSEPYGGETIIQSHVFLCNTCGFLADDSEYNDPLIQEGLAVLRRQSMVNVLTELNSLGLSNASMERTLGLPARTLARWKNEPSMNPSAAALALMKIIRTFPWILAVADQRYDAKSAQAMVVQQAFSILMDSFSSVGDKEMSKKLQELISIN